MNCCNDYGVCTRGHGCPCGDDPVTPVAVAPIKASKPAEAYVNPMSSVPVGHDPTWSLSWREKAFVASCVVVLGTCTLLVIGSALGVLWASFGQQFLTNLALLGLAP